MNINRLIVIYIQLTNTRNRLFFVLDLFLSSCNSSLFIIINIEWKNCNKIITIKINESKGAYFQTINKHSLR